MPQLLGNHSSVDEQSLLTPITGSKANLPAQIATDGLGLTNQLCRVTRRKAVLNWAHLKRGKIPNVYSGVSPFRGIAERSSLRTDTWLSDFTFLRFMYTTRKSGLVSRRYSPLSCLELPPRLDAHTPAVLQCRNADLPEVWFVNGIPIRKSTSRAGSANERSETPNCKSQHLLFSLTFLTGNAALR